MSSTHTPHPCHTLSKVCVLWFCSVSLRSQWVAIHRPRESITASRLSVSQSISQSTQRADQSGTAASPLLISSIDCLNGYHWRWRDRQAAFVKSTERSCDGPLSLLLLRSRKSGSGVESMWGLWFVLSKFRTFCNTLFKKVHFVASAWTGCFTEHSPCKQLSGA